VVLKLHLYPPPLNFFEYFPIEFSTLAIPRVLNMSLNTLIERGVFGHAMGFVPGSVDVGGHIFISQPPFYNMGSNMFDLWKLLCRTFYIGDYRTI